VVAIGAGIAAIELQVLRQQGSNRFLELVKGESFRWSWRWQHFNRQKHIKSYSINKQYH
jgi:hypothetical protein